MAIYILKRVALAIPLLFAVSLVTFLMVHIMPGNAAQILAGDYASQEDIQRITVSLGLDKPLHVQYLIYIGRVLQGDLGTSIVNRVAVTKLILLRYPLTLKLALFGLVLATVVGTLFGVLSAVHPGKFSDVASRILALIGMSAPAFFLGLVLMYAFSVQWRLFPLSGGEGIGGIVLPAVTLSLRTMAVISRMTRSSMLNVLSQDYILMARAQGLSKAEVVIKHAFKNVLNTVITVVAIELAYCLGGSVVTETVFAIPGIGRLLVEAILGRDVPLMQGTLLVVASVFVLINLLVDIIYTVVNPKISLARAQAG